MRRSRQGARAALAAVVVLAMAACSTGAEEGSKTGSAGASASASDTAAAPTETRGPNGEKPTPVSALTLSDADVATLKAGHYTAAFVWHASSDFSNAVQAGAKDEFTRLGISVVATTDAAMDPAKQKSDVETVLAKKPSVMLTLPVDPVSGAEAYRPAVEAGTKLVLLSNLPRGFTQGKEYVAIVTDDLFQMGKMAADALAKAIGGKGKVGYVFHDATYYVTNQRDEAFKAVIRRDYPGIEIVAEEGISDPARAEDIANAMLTRHPDLDGMYVTWADPAEGALAALRNAGNTHTRIVTLDLSEPVALDMLRGGNVVGIVADRAYDLGAGMARAAAYGLLGRSAPPFLVAPALTVTKENLVPGWRESLHRDPPATLLGAAK